MKILNVIRTMDPSGGGPQEGVRQMSSCLAKMGHTAETISLDGENIAPCRWNYGYSPRFIPRLLKNTSGYDAVLVHGLWQFHGLGTYLASKKNSFPYFVYAHGMLDEHFKKAYPIKHLKKSIYWHLFENRILRASRAVLFTAEDELLSAERSFNLNGIQKEITGYGTAKPPGDADSKRGLFFNKYPGLSGKELFIFLGRVHEKKGIDLALKSFSASIKNHPNIHLLISGPYHPKYRRRLERFIDTAGLTGKVTWLGMVTGDLKWGALYASKALILPSHQENFSFACVEALGCGVPVLISNKVNIWREIKDSSAGLISGDNESEAASMLQEFLRLDEDKIQLMSQNAKICFNKFEINISAKRLIDVIQKYGIK